MPSKKKNKGNRKVPQTESTISIDNLVKLGNEALAKMEPEHALSYFQQAHKMKYDDTNIMDSLDDVYLQLSEPEQAYQLLVQSTTSAPSDNPCKWFLLGQLQSGFDAIDSYRTGIRYLNAVLDEESEVCIQFLRSSNHSYFPNQSAPLPHRKKIEQTSPSSWPERTAVSPRSI